MAPTDATSEKPNEPSLDALGAIESACSEAEVLERLGTLSKRGKLPGFVRRGGDGLFSVTAMGAYFDRVLIGDAEGIGEGTRIRFRTMLPRRMTGIVIFVLAFTVWPGVWMTDSMLATYWGWYGEKSADMPWLTYAWYLPLTVIPLPWAFWSVMRKNDRAAAASAAELIERMAGVLDGRVVRDG